MKEPITTSAVTGQIKNVLGNGRGTLILAIIGVGLSTASTFMFCLASVGFDFTQLSEPAFWSSWASVFMTMICSYALVILHKDEKNRLNEWYVEKMTLIMNLSTAAGLSFDEYLEWFNLQRRIAWYKNDINAKIAKLNGKIIKYKLKGKPTDILEKQIETFRACLAEEYIEENKYSLQTRSKPIRSSQVLTESKKGTDGEENFRSPSAYYSVKVVLKIVMYFVIAVAFAAVVVQNFMVGVDVAAITKTILSCLSIVLAIISAIFAANGCYKTVYVPNLLFKIKILTGYGAWKEEKVSKDNI